jgi:predicted nucleic acid-binding protein
MKAVVNATPLIALSVTGHLDLLEQLFELVYLPHSVYEEVVDRGRDRPGSLVVQQADWLNIQQPSQTSPIPVALMGLDIGEQDVILLGQELNADWLIIDERLGRKIAQAMNFRVKGTLGILLVARQRGLISAAEAKQAVQQLHQSSVRISPRLLFWFQSQLESE